MEVVTAITMKDIEKQWSPRITQLAQQIKMLVNQIKDAHNMDTSNMRKRLFQLRKQKLALQIRRDSEKNRLRKTLMRVRR